MVLALCIDTCTVENRLKNVILIDDDEATHFIHRLTMERSGLVNEITPFAEAESALHFLKELDQNQSVFPDLILLDLNMPGFDGWDFLEGFKDIRFPASSRLAVLSTSINPEDQTRAMLYPQVCEFLIKPLKIAAFQEFMARQFGGN